jgi:hypothetical protein
VADAGSGGGVRSEADRNSPVFVIKHGDELRARSECFEVLAAGR